MSLIARMKVRLALPVMRKAVCFIVTTFLAACVYAAKEPALTMGPGISDTKLVVSNEAVLEEGKALFENGQYLDALGKFMAVLRQDPHQSQ